MVIPCGHICLTRSVWLHCSLTHHWPGRSLFIISLKLTALRHGSSSSVCLSLSTLAGSLYWGTYRVACRDSYILPSSYHMVRASINMLLEDVSLNQPHWHKLVDLTTLETFWVTVFYVVVPCGHASLSCHNVCLTALQLGISLADPLHSIPEANWYLGVHLLFALAAFFLLCAVH